MAKIKDFLSKLIEVKEDSEQHWDSSSSFIFSNLHFYRTLFSQQTDGVVLLNPDGKVIDCNQKMAEMFRVGLKDLKQNFFRIIDNDSQKTDLHHFKKALKGETREYTSVRYKDDGSSFNTRTTLAPIKVHKQVAAVLGIFRDDSPYSKMKDHFTRVQTIAGIGVWDYFPDEDLITWSDQIYSIFGIENKTSFVPTAKKFIQIVHHEDREMFRNAFFQAVMDGVEYELEYRIMKLGGEIRTCHIKTDVFRNKKGKVVKLTGTLQDITEIKEMEKLVQKRELHMQNMIRALDLVELPSDEKNKQIIFCSPQLHKILASSTNRLINDIDHWKSFLYPEDRKTVEKAEQILLNGNSITYEYRIIDPAGKVYWIEERSIPTLDENGNLLQVERMMIDISERKSFEEKIKHVANHDYLTGLSNRRQFEEEFKKAIDRTLENDQILALLVLNIDRFHHIIDAFGISVGDQLLKEFSKRLSEVCGGNVYLARFSGDEFGLFIENISSMDDGVDLSYEIFKMVKEPFTINDHKIFITVSIGISFAPNDGDDVSNLIKNAIIAMKKAKQSGGNDFYVYTPSMSLDTYKKYLIEKELHHAILNGGLYLEYQPKINPLTGMVESAEALIRWQHHEWGFVKPIEFIPIAEKNGLILSISDWVLKQVCRQLKVWREKGLSLVPISINIPYKRLAKKDFMNTVLTIVKESGISPHLIEFEITEWSSIHDEDVVIFFIKKMQTLGFKFSFDDFGTRQSSISNLCALEIDTIKIDRTFIEEIGKSKRAESIISSLIALANNIGVKVVAEGVETEQQFQFLLERKCHLIQGYLISPPIRPQQFEKVLAKPCMDLSQKKTEKNKQTIMKSTNYSIMQMQLPIIAEMTIINMKDRLLTMGYSKIVVDYMNASHLSFITDIDLPENNNTILKFSIPIGSEIREITGTVEWKKEEGDRYRYGIKLHSQLMQEINTFN